MLALTVCIPAGWSAPAPAADYPKMAPLAQYLPRIGQAKSSWPERCTQVDCRHATILTLGKDGYETAVKGSNGFVCFIQRSWANDFDWAANSGTLRIRTPQCWNAAAVSSLLKDYLNRTQWVLAGASQKRCWREPRRSSPSHEIGPPAPGSMAYMMSKKQYINDPSPQGQPQWYPHVMFFVPATDGSPWGANGPAGPLFSATSDAEPVSTYFLVVPNWSDGTQGPYVTNPGKAKKHHHG